MKPVLPFEFSPISRRGILKGAAQAGAAMALASGFPSLARAVEPKRGGHLRVGRGHGSASDTLDPATYSNNFMTCFANGFLSCLAEIDNHGNIVPEIASSWDAEDNSRRWVFHLRKGVEFHNGKTVTADDVIASVNHHRGPDSKSAFSEFVAIIADIRKIDAQTVQFDLADSYRDFPSIVGDYRLGIFPSSEGKIDWQSGIGAGPFVIESFDPGVQAHLKRNPNYFKSGKPYFDEVTLSVVLDSTARTNALLSNELDLIDKVDLKTVSLLQGTPGLRVESIKALMHYTFPMKCDLAPFDDNDVRLAIKYAFDREQLLETILAGYGSVGNDHPVASTMRYFNSELEQRTYDPDRARFHLKQAGLTSLKIPLHTSSAAFVSAEEAALVVKDNAAAAGIDIDVIREPSDGYWSNTWMKVPFCQGYWSGRPVADMLLSWTYAANSTWNESFWKHEKFNQILETARSEADEDARTSAYWELQRILRDEGGSVIPLFADHVWAEAEAVQHDPVVATNFELDGEKCLERWWFA